MVVETVSRNFADLPHLSMTASRPISSSILYGYLNRIRSTRGLERESHRNVELMWLIRKLHPDFKTVADFRKDNIDGIRSVCREFILLCRRMELFGRELIAIDGSKFKAANSKKRNFTAGKVKRMIRETERKVERRSLPLRS